MPAKSCAAPATGGRIKLSMSRATIATLGDDGALRRRERLCWLVALALGFLQAWGRRHISADGLSYIGADSIAYLDQGDAWLRGDFATAVNAMWSPLYPWLLGLTLRIFRPSPYQEFTVARLLNFVIYALALAAFAYCLRGLLRMRGAHIIFGREAAKPPHAEAGNATAPGWLAPHTLLLLGYALFIWTSLQMNRVSRISPDLLVAALVYLATGLLLRIRAGDTRSGTFALLGLALGCGYLAKTVMFPLAFVWLACVLFARRQPRRAAPRVLLALFVFLLVAGPFVFALSRAKQRLTIGDSGRLNYAWYVNRVTPFTHWQGETPSGGTPAHPTRHICAAPDVYEFAAPIRATYPPWYDPTYWYEGVQPRFNLRQQAHTIAHNALLLLRYTYARFFLLTTLLGLALLFAISGRGRRLGRDIAAYWLLSVPALAACGLYLLINVEVRYLAPFVTLVALSLFAAISLPAHKSARRMLPLLIACVLLTGALSLAPAVARDALATAHDAVNGSVAADVQWQVADELHKAGVPQGAPVAVVGDAMFAAWPRLARVRVVAELPARAGNVETFWAADEERRQQVLATAFAVKAGAQAVIAQSVPSQAARDGWRPLGTTGYYVLFLAHKPAHAELSYYGTSPLCVPLCAVASLREVILWRETDSRKDATAQSAPHELQ